MYYALGVLFAIVFITMGISKVDEGAKETSIGFRLILIPGIALFWPVLLNKWRKAK